MCLRRGGNKGYATFVVVGMSAFIAIYIFLDVTHKRQTILYAGEQEKLNSENKVSSTGPVYNSDSTTRLLCWVTTTAGNLQSRTKYVQMTWGKRCDVLLFFGSFQNSQFPVINLDVREGRGYLAQKTQAALTYVYNHHRNDADWFLKADDDTFVLVDNLKHFLMEYQTAKPLYFGFTFTGLNKVPQGYNSGGAGYVLSQESLRRFNTEGVDGKKCRVTHPVEDVHIGECMHTLGVLNVNTLDRHNRTRFHAYTPSTHMDLTDPYLKTRSSYGRRTGAQNISAYPFTFHYLTGHEIRMMEFLIYHIRHVGDGGTVLK